MNKAAWFLASFSVWIFVFFASDTKSVPAAPLFPAPPLPQILPPAPLPPTPSIPLDSDLVGVQVPIPKNCRVYNRSGVQCVWCSIECLCRYHGIKEVYEGENRITKHYTWATGPGEVARVLPSRYPTLKWKQIFSTTQKKAFVKKYVTEKRFGVGLAVPGHMLNLIHYDEEADVVKIIDNLGPKALQVQTWDMNKFNRLALADGWVLTVFPPGQEETSSDFDERIPHIDRLYGDFRN